MDMDFTCLTECFVVKAVQWASYLLFRDCPWLAVQEWERFVISLKLPQSILRPSQTKTLTNFSIKFLMYSLRKAMLTHLSYTIIAVIPVEQDRKRYIRLLTVRTG